MQTSLIITTYNWPQALDLVLKSVLHQSVLPDEVIIADDGSENSTKTVIDKYRQNYPIPLHHEWQEDTGFRVARVRNLGASKAHGTYLIFVDGDMLLHPEFINSHMAHQREGRFLHGPRVLLSDNLANELLTGKRDFGFHALQKGITNRLNTIHSLPLSRVFSRQSYSWQSRACNFSLFKSDLMRVNGFNEDFEGWGKEDSEFASRLIRAGIKKINLRLCGVAYHLGHAQSNERTHLEDLRRNEVLLNKIIATEVSWCENGLSNHIASPILKTDA